MFQLALHVCLLTNPTACHWEYLTSAAPSYNQCMMDQVSMAKFIGDHPNFIITKWHCNADGKTEADL